MMMLLNQEAIDSRKNKSMLNWFGHVIKVDNKILVRKVPEEKAEKESEKDVITVNRKNRKGKREKPK